MKGIYIGATTQFDGLLYSAEYELFEFSDRQYLIKHNELGGDSIINKEKFIIIENDEDFDDTDEVDDVIDYSFVNIYITRKEIEQLLSKGSIDIEAIESECKDCSSESVIMPTLILKD